MMNKFVQLNVLPDGLDWNDWHSSVIHDYGELPLPFIEEKDWRDFANALVGLPGFIQFDIPDAESVDTWQEWAALACGAVNGARTL